MNTRALRRSRQAEEARERRSFWTPGMVATIAACLGYWGAALYVLM